MMINRCVFLEVPTIFDKPIIFNQANNIIFNRANKCVFFQMGDPKTIQDIQVGNLDGVLKFGEMGVLPNLFRNTRW
jgi:hypothetical protein